MKKKVGGGIIEIFI